MTRYEITRRQTVVILESQHSKAGYHIDEHGHLQVAWVNTGDGNPCTVRACMRRAGDGYVCAQCVEEWETCLGDIPALVEDLNIAIRKDARFGTREGNAVASTGGYDPTRADSIQPRHLHTRHPNHVEPPDMYDARASDRLAELGNELVGQVRLICESQGLEVPALGGDVVGMSRWLLGMADRLTYLPEQDGAGLVGDLTRVYLASVAAIDAPARKKYVTGCSCGLAVFAHSEDDRTTCACGITYDVAEQHAERMKRAADRLVTVAEATASGAKKDTIKKWIKRGRLMTVGSDPQRVRYGNVLDLVSEMKEKTA